MNKKIIVKNVVRRKEGYMYYVDGEGNICEQELEKPPKKYLQFLVYLDDEGKFTIVYSKIGNKKYALKLFRKTKLNEIREEYKVGLNKRSKGTNGK